MLSHSHTRPTNRPAVIPARRDRPAANVYRPEKFAAQTFGQDTAAVLADPDRPIPHYSRADAIADGLLIEVPRNLTANFRLPAQTVITGQLWADAVATAAHPNPPAPARPVWPGDGLPADVRDRLVDLLWLAYAYRATEPGRVLAHTFVLWRVPALLAPSTGGDEATPIRVTCTVHAGDCGEVVATIAHAGAETAGTFHLAGEPSRAWPAVRFDPDTVDGYARPVVTVETLAAILTDAAGTHPADPPEVDAEWTDQGWVRVDTGGAVHTLKPSEPGIYPLGALGWPLLRTTSPAGVDQ